MAEYIEREAVVMELNKTYDNMNAMGAQFYCGFMNAVHRIKDFPAADVAPVVHGRWEDSIDEWLGTDVYTCSKCRESYVLLEGTPKENLWHYCPNCGANMESEE